MLYRAELIYILILWNYHKSAGMLSCGPLYSGTSLHQSVHFGIMQGKVMILNISFYISESRFIRKGSNGTGFKHMTLSKEHFCVGMGLLLVFSGEVKVDIWFLIPVESKECLKWYVMSVFFHHCAALGAGLIRHVHSGTALHKYLMHFLRLKV